MKTINSTLVVFILLVIGVGCFIASGLFPNKEGTLITGGMVMFGASVPFLVRLCQEPLDNDK